MIGHKSQGVTNATKVVIDIKETFAHGFTCVMFAKVTNWNNFKIIRNLTLSDFIPHNFKIKTIMQWNQEKVNNSLFYVKKNYK